MFLHSGFFVRGSSSCSSWRASSGQTRNAHRRKRHFAITCLSPILPLMLQMLMSCSVSCLCRLWCRECLDASYFSWLLQCLEGGRYFLLEILPSQEADVTQTEADTYNFVQTFFWGSECSLALLIRDSRVEKILCRTHCPVNKTPRFSSSCTALSRVVHAVDSREAFFGTNSSKKKFSSLSVHDFLRESSDFCYFSGIRCGWESPKGVYLLRRRKILSLRARVGNVVSQSIAWKDNRTFRFTGDTLLRTMLLSPCKSLPLLLLFLWCEMHLIFIHDHTSPSSLGELSSRKVE